MADLEAMTKDELYWEYDRALVRILHDGPAPDRIARQTAAEDELTRRALPWVREGHSGNLYSPDRQRDFEGEESWALRTAGEEDQDSGEWGA